MTKGMTQSEAYPREFKISRNGAYRRVVLYGQHTALPKPITALLEFHTLEEVRQARDLLNEVLAEGEEPEQAPAIDNFFSPENKDLEFRTAPQRAFEAGLATKPPKKEPEEPSKKAKNKKKDSA